ncbi:hypothetical protein F5Y15DRAFT_398573 [Xylariaceae sp. FL0016]|nr:hypothetical protein F5Y15DRAFT_398573 [Xylariaceae sp. FL0016]
MADEELLHKIQNLGDLDLAALLCLISREHCIISTEPPALDDLVAELQLVASQTFNLSSVVVDCTPHTTLDDLVATIQLPIPSTTPRSSSPLLSRNGGGSGGATTTDSYFNTHSHAHGHSHSHGTHLHSHTNAHGPPLRALSPLTPSLPSHAGGASASAHQPQIANVVLARDLDRAPRAVQIQCLELLRTRRIFTRTSVLSCPRPFLFVAVLGAASGGEARLTRHLNDAVFIAHWHDPEDGFAHLEEEEGRGPEGRYGRDNDDGSSVRTKSSLESRDSSQSVVRRKSDTRTPTPGWERNVGRRIPTSNPRTPAIDSTDEPSPFPTFSESDVSTLADLTRSVHTDIDVTRYQMNLVSFLRLHRAMTPGCVSPTATKHLAELMRSLAVLHGLRYVTPGLVGLAARKVYLHRILIVEPERERSMQWGSSLATVEKLLEGVGPEEVIEEVLVMVDAPL